MQPLLIALASLSLHLQGRWVARWCSKRMPRLSCEFRHLGALEGAPSVTVRRALHVKGLGRARAAGGKPSVWA